MIDLPEIFLPLKYNIFAARCIHYYKEFITWAAGNIISVTVFTNKM